MTRSRQILVVVLVASALCADEAGVAAPVHRAEATSVASRIVTRISVSFRRVVTAIRICQPLREGTSPVQRITTPAANIFIPALLEPFHFRLPPPAI